MRKSLLPWMLGALLSGIGAMAGPAAADEEPVEPPPVKQVDLDKLLTLPSGRDYSVPRKGGATKGEWQVRFREAHSELEIAEEELAESQAKLEKSSKDSGSWTLGMPGPMAKQEGQDKSSNYSVIQDIKRQKAEVERAERTLQELEVEANLAGVPEDWRE